jgi:enamine deaminase RidA (YjgF/YER057c/UK114 family)
MSAIRHHNCAMSETGSAYSHAVTDGNYAFLAGQLAADAKHRTVAMGDIADETRAAMELLQGVLRDLGLDFGDVLRVNVYLADPELFEGMNAVYRSFFALGKLPARTTVITRLLYNCLVEIDCVARLRR